MSDSEKEEEEKTELAKLAEQYEKDYEHLAGNFEGLDFPLIFRKLGEGANAIISGFTDDEFTFQANLNILLNRSPDYSDEFGGSGVVDPLDADNAPPISVHLDGTMYKDGKLISQDEALLFAENTKLQTMRVEGQKDRSEQEDLPDVDELPGGQPNIKVASADASKKFDIARQDTGNSGVQPDQSLKETFTIDPKV